MFIIKVAASYSFETKEEAEKAGMALGQVIHDLVEKDYASCDGFAAAIIQEVQEPATRPVPRTVDPRAN